MTTDARPIIEPKCELPLSEAVQELTGFEALAVEKRFGMKLENMGGTGLTIGVVWAYENRNEKRSWASVEGMTFRELTGYFVDEPEDPDEGDPDSDVGKGD